MAIFSKTTEEGTERKAKKAAVKDAKEKKLSVKESALAETVLSRPRITEKAYALNALNQYVFVVSPRATKGTVKTAVEEAYGVHVTQVRMIHLPKKKSSSNVSRNAGFKKSLKKAIVSLGKGETLELFKGGI